MLQLRALLFGLSIVGAIGFAVYSYVNSRNQEDPHGTRRRRHSNSTDDADSLGLPRRRTVGLREKCSICLDNIEKKFVILRCTHRFHDRCIEAWFDMGQTTCPLCRMQVH